jgi:hypothetical protein
MFDTRACIFYLDCGDLQTAKAERGIYESPVGSVHTYIRTYCLECSGEVSLNSSRVHLKTGLD